MPGGGPLFLGVDVGTQGTKALVYEQKTGKVLSRGAKAYHILKTTVPGRAEQHPSAWIEVFNIRFQQYNPTETIVELCESSVHPQHMFA